MIYYSENTNETLTERQIEKRGLTPQALTALGIYPIREVQPDIDGRYYQLIPGEIVKTEDGYIRNWNIEPLPLLFIRSAKKEAVTSLRWEKETGGISLNGVSVLTGVDDQNRIATAIQGMQVAGMDKVDFKAASGWVELTLPELQAIAAAISQYVQACFSREKALHAEIVALEDAEALIALDIESGWPPVEVGAV